jgi:RNA polymerase sigma factor (sigma-70 family)
VDHRLLALARQAGDTRPDAGLLARLRDDPAAFAELVARHGPMVWGVCRHLLGDADAEDAFQATFLVLHRSVPRDPAALAAWLHGVAVRVSLAVRRQAGRRRRRERVAAAPEAVPSFQPDDWADTMAVVHREVAALPAADRAAFVLCVLEGRTQAEAAARLGRTPGAVAGQVARAKKRLVARLAGRGVAPGLAALGAASVAGAVPPSVAGRALGLPSAGVSPAVLRLVRGETGMTTFGSKMILAGVLTAAGLAAGVLAATSGPPGMAPDEGPPKPTRAPAGSPEAKGRPAPRPLTSGDLSGTWVGEKDGVKVRVTFRAGDDVLWSVTTEKGSNHASLKREDDGASGTVHLRFYSALKPRTGTVFGSVGRGAGGDLHLTILPAAAENSVPEYKAVERIPLQQESGKK